MISYTRVTRDITKSGLWLAESDQIWPRIGSRLNHKEHGVLATCSLTRSQVVIRHQILDPSFTILRARMSSEIISVMTMESGKMSSTTWVSLSTAVIMLCFICTQFLFCIVYDICRPLSWSIFSPAWWSFSLMCKIKRNIAKDTSKSLEVSNPAIFPLI